MQPKPSQRRTWSIPANPVSIWPKPKSTPWWKKTATLASSSPAHTWSSAERLRLANQLYFEKTILQAADIKGHKLTDAQWRLERFTRNKYLSPRSFTPSCGVIMGDAYRLASELNTWSCEKRLTQTELQAMSASERNTCTVRTGLHERQPQWHKL